jgi:hypothetical protein
MSRRAEEHQVHAPTARVIEQVGDRRLAGAPVEVREVLRREPQARDVRIERADAGEIAQVRGVGGARHRDGEDGQRRGDAGGDDRAVVDLAGHGRHHRLRPGGHGLGQHYATSFAAARASSA